MEEAQFEIMAEEYHFHRIDATCSIREVFQALSAAVEQVVADMKPVSPPGVEKALAETEAESKPKERKR
jgi:hypothetical protein